MKNAAMVSVTGTDKCTTVNATVNAIKLEAKQHNQGRNHSAKTKTTGRGDGGRGVQI